MARDLAAEARRKFPIGATVVWKRDGKEIGTVIGYGTPDGEVIYKNRLTGRWAGNSQFNVTSPSYLAKAVPA
jgi:hypothetical protein